jgi:hypothetical protein
VKRIVVVSIVGVGRFTAGHNAASWHTSRPSSRARSRSASCAPPSSTSSSDSSSTGAPKARSATCPRCAPS